MAEPNLLFHLTPCSDATTRPQPALPHLAAAARLLEAASSARLGDTEATKSHVTAALALLESHGTAASGAAGTRAKGRRSAPHGGLAPWQERRLAAHIDANLAGEIRIKDLALLFKISTSHFCRAFRRTFGVSARTWIAGRRIEVAKSLMVCTAAPLSEIALNCGMSDQSHFTRAFRHIVGITPHLWRQTRRGLVEDQITDLACARANRARWTLPERG